MKLIISGLVAHTMTFSVDDLAGLPHQTLAQERSVHHQEGAEPHLWGGVPLLTLLLAAEPSDEARFVAAGGGDFVVALPLLAVTEHDPLIADSLNGSPISAERGGPLRLVAANARVFHSVKALDRLVLANDNSLDTVTKKEQRGEKKRQRRHPL